MNIIKNQSGFSLAELMVSIMIMTMITGLFMVNYNTYKKQGNLNMAAQEIASQIRIVQNYALASKMESGNIPKGGWGIYFSNSTTVYNGLPYNRQLIIFADDGAISVAKMEVSEYVESIELPKGIIILDAIYPNASGNFVKNCNETSLAYRPPAPNITIKGSGCSGGTVDEPEMSKILIKNTEGDEKIIIFNNMGLVDVE